MKFQFRTRWSWATPVEVEIAAEFEGRSYRDQLAAALRVISEKHARWRRGEEGGTRADLTRADLTGADLTGANLTGANLTSADLTRADLTRADLTGADLTGANLTGADLTRADLTGAKIRDKAGNEVKVTRQPLILCGLDYRVIVWDRHMQIGCELHPVSDWRAFGDRRIAEMDRLRALRFWRRHKDALLALAESDGRGGKPAQVEDPQEDAA